MDPFVNCSPQCWMYKLLFEIEFMKENKFMTRVERWGFIDRMLKKYRDKNPVDFDLFFSNEQIVAMAE